jgi:phthalate 4,5-cis-dihydrodiol dehydrogenase
LTALRPEVLRLGIVGLGTAGRSLLAPIEAHRETRLVAVCDPAAPDAAEVAARFGARTYASIEALLDDPDVDAVYIATPTELHEQHAVLAAQARKHVLVEKPMAIELAQAQRMIDAAERAGVVLLVGHSHSYDEPYRAMREVIASGTLGRVRVMHSMYFSDWLYRPRRPEELDASRGGGITFRQGAHQFDILRLLGGGLVQSVRAKTFDWDPARPAIGAHSAFLTFANGAVATALYNGYGAFLSAELCWGIGELGSPLGVEEAGAKRREFRARAGADEREAKRQRAAAGVASRAPFQPFFGWIVASCEGGDLRQSPTGLYQYTERGREEIALRTDRSTRDLVLAELVDTILGRRRALHDGRWGLANLEVCEAVLTSSALDREVALSHQVSCDEPVTVTQEVSFKS